MKKIFFVIWITLCVLFVEAQQSKRIDRLFEKAKQEFFQLNYSEAIKTANKILSSDIKNTNAHQLLAEIYYSIDSVDLEINHLKIAFENNSENKNQIGYQLGEALFSKGDYKQSLEIFKSIFEEGGISENMKELITKRIESCHFAIEAIQNPVSGEAKNIGQGVNTSSDEYWPVLSIDGRTLIFTRLLEMGRGFKQEDFYSSNLVSGEWEEAIPLSEINTYENEGAQTISADGSLMFFSACNRDDGFGSCDIYFSRKVDGKWTKPRNAGEKINTNAWESQPSLAANSGYLYFVSNRGGGKGKMDIWRCELKHFNERGMPEWGDPQNLGDINTPENELSPFIHFNGKTLYFASDYWTGFGKKDIFYSELNSDMVWSEPVNLGFPINTVNDEQGFFVDASGETAYYASKRNGNMDIYYFNLYPEFQPTPATYLKGIVVDASTGTPLQAEIELNNIKQKSGEKIYINQKGEFTLCLPLNNNYAFFISKPGYLFYSATFELEKVFKAEKPFVIEIQLQPIAEGASVVLKNIYFETGSFELLPESEPELKKIEKLLTENPGIRIQIEGHTDNVGGEEYNIELSGNRAKSVYEFLTGKGIEKERLIYKGFGFSQPVASNESDEGRQLNRRTKIRIIDSGNTNK